jgi:lipoprotein-releasing system permease protein
MRFIESLFHIDILDDGIYFVSEIPSQWQWSDVVLVSAVALVMSWLATIYPAWRAMKVEPAKALHERG